MLGGGKMSRAQRFALRLEGRDVPSFDLIAAPPAWRVAESAERAELTMVAALLHARPAIDRELHGPALARLAAAVGEARFDAVCAADTDGLPQAAGGEALPQPGDLAQRGGALLQRAVAEPAYAALASVAAELLAANPAQRWDDAA